MGVELHHPIANDLERHPADLRRLRPARAFVNRGQRQKPPGLRPILRPPCGGPHHPRIKISPKWNWHGEPPALATLNQTHADSGISPSESRLLSFGISRGGSLVRRRARTRAALGPAAGDLVLLADAGLVGEPDLYGGGLDALLAPDLVQARGKAFLKSSIAPSACS